MSFYSLSKLAFGFTVAGVALYQGPLIVVNRTPLKDRGLVVDGRTYVPLRLVASALGADVEFVAEDNEILINSSGSSQSLPLRDIRGAWNPTKIREWTDRVLAWYAKCETLLSLIDSSAITGTTETSRMYAEALRAFVEAIKANHAASFGMATNLREYPYDLDIFETTYDHLSGMAAALSDISEYDSNPRLVGVPSTELSSALTRHATVAHTLLTEAMGHRSALFSWYGSKAGNPKW